MLYPSPIQLSHVYGPTAHGVLHGGPKLSNANGGFVSALLTNLFVSYRSITITINSTNAVVSIHGEQHNIKRVNMLFDQRLIIHSLRHKTAHKTYKTYKNR